MKKIVMVGIAGTNKDFLISLPMLKAYLYQFKEIYSEYKIEILHYPLDVNVNTVINEISKLKADYVCFSCYMWNIEKIKVITRIVRLWDALVTIIYGGPEIEEDKHYDYVDYAIAKESEAKLYKIIVGKTPPKQEYKDYPSAYLTNSVPSIIFKREGIRVNFEGQKGCSYSCRYCNYHKNFKNIKYRNPIELAKEIEYCSKKGIRQGKIVDANFSSNLNFAKTVLKYLIKTKVHMRICIDMIPGFYDDELIDYMNQYIKLHKYNNFVVGIGLQTLNQESLQVIGRTNNKRKLIDTIDKLSQKGIHIRLDLLIGLPRENINTYDNALEFVIEQMKKGKHFLGLYPLKVLPGTNFDRIIDKENINIKGNDIVSTPDLTENELIICRRLSEIAAIIFGSKQIDNGYKLPKMFFNACTNNELNYVQFIEIISDQLNKKHISEKNITLILIKINSL